MYLFRFQHVATSSIALLIAMLFAFVSVHAQALKNGMGTITIPNVGTYGIDSVEYTFGYDATQQATVSEFDLIYNGGQDYPLVFLGPAELGLRQELYDQSYFLSTDLKDGKGGVSCTFEGLTNTSQASGSFSYSRWIPQLHLSSPSDTLNMTLSMVNPFFDFHLLIDGSLDDTDDQSYWSWFSQKYVTRNSNGKQIGDDSDFWDFLSADTTERISDSVKTPGLYSAQLTFVADTMIFVPDTGITFYFNVKLAKYQYSCLGLPFLIFDASYDTTGEYTQNLDVYHTGTGWKDAGIGMIRDTGLIVINNFLRFQGSLTLDTVSNRIDDMNGKLFVFTTLPFSESPGIFKLDSGNLTYFGSWSYSCNGLVSIAKSLLATDSIHSSPSDSLAGYGFKFDSISFITDSTGLTGIQAGATVKLNNLMEVGGPCSDSGSTTPSSPQISIAPIQITSNGIGGAIHAGNIGFGRTFCVSDVFISYYSQPDSLSFGAQFKTPWIDNVGFGVGIKHGYFDAFNFNAQQSSGGIPIGETTLLLSGLRGGVSGLASLGTTVISPIKCTVGGTFDEAIPNTMQWLGDLTYNEPSSLKGSITLNILNIPGIGWQCVGNVTAEVNWKQFVKFSGSFMEGTLGNGYIFNGSGDLMFTWNPSFSVIGKATGTLSIPKVPGTNAISSYINSYLPIQFGGIEAYTNLTASTGVYKANITLPWVGSAHVVVNCSPASINFGSGTVPLSITAQRGKEITLSLPLDSISVPANMAFAVIRIRANGLPPASTLIDPSGATHTPGSSDTLIGYRTDTSTQCGFWAIRNPAPGTWVLSMPARTASDTVDAQAEPVEDPIICEATQSGKQVTVAWSPLTNGDTAEVDVFLDDSSNTYTGFRIASADDRAGTLTFDLADSLPQCTYYLYAMRDNGTYVSESYSPDPLDNSKSSISAPTGLTAQYHGDTVSLQWDSVTSPGVSGYAINVSDGYGNDSIYASVPAYANSATLLIPDPAAKWINVYAFTEGVLSCWSNSVAASSGVTQPAGEFIPNGLDLQFWPNPAGNEGELTFTLDSREQVTVSLLDVLGRKVLTPIVGSFDPGTHTVSVDVSALPMGTYYCRAQAGTSIQTMKISIER